MSFADTGTSILAGVTIFSILGNLAYETGRDVDQVVTGGTGLAFVSYPDAISKFDAVPQLFAVLFFLMLITLAIGSATGLTGCIVTIICDEFPKWPRWVVTIAVCSAVNIFLFAFVYNNILKIRLNAELFNWPGLRHSSKADDLSLFEIKKTGLITGFDISFQGGLYILDLVIKTNIN